MASTRTISIAVGAMVVLVGAAIVVLTSGETPTFQLKSTSNIIRIEAAGVNYSGWPDMSVIVNGENIESLTVDLQQRKMYVVNVPNEVGDISTIEIKFTNETDCQKADFSIMATCTNRALIVRGLYLNDEKLEGGVPSGEKNMASLLQTSEGGITWKIDK